MASGAYLIALTTPTVFGAPGPWNPGNIATMTTLGEEPATGGSGDATYVIGGDNLIWLVPDGEVAAVPTRILELPSGFQFLDVLQGDQFDGSGDGPTFIYGLFRDNAGTHQLTTWSFPGLGWSPGVTPFTEAVQKLLIALNFTLTASYIASTYTVTIGLFNGSEAPSPIAATGLAGTYDDLGPQVTPGEATVELGPGDNEITITPGPDTVIVVVDDGDEEQIIEVDEGVPVVVEVGATPVTVTPVNYPIAVGPPTEVDVPIVLEMTGIIPIDIALAPSMRLVCNPSGIYTLVPGQKYDVLYERVAGTTVATSQTVAIPRPYGITTYIPEQD